MCVLLTVWGHVQVITISRSCPSKSQQIIVLQPQAQATDGADTKLPWAAANIYHFPNHSCWPRSSIQFPQWQPEFDSSYSEISSEFEAATVWCLSFTILWQQKSVKVQNLSFRRLKFHLCLIPPLVRSLVSGSHQTSQKKQTRDQHRLSQIVYRHVNEAFKEWFPGDFPRLQISRKVLICQSLIELRLGLTYKWLRCNRKVLRIKV